MPRRRQFRVYRMPVLGGTPQLLVSDVDVGPTFSPDGKRMAYIRANDPEAGKYRLLSSNLDGSDEKILQIAALPMPGALSWSPDGKRIAFISYSQSNAQGQISIFDIASSKDTPLTSFPDRVFTDLAWTPDGRGLLVNLSRLGRNQPANRLRFLSRRPIPLAHQRHARLSHAKPFWRRQSDGLDSAARDGFCSRCRPRNSNAAPATVPGLPNQAEVRRCRAWDSQGDLIVTTANSILRMSPDGSRQTTLLSDPSETIFRVVGLPSRRAHSVRHLSSGRKDSLRTSGAWMRMARAQSSSPTARMKDLRSARRMERPFTTWTTLTSRIMKMPIDGGPRGAHQGQRSPQRIHARRSELFARWQVDAGDRDVNRCGHAIEHAQGRAR